MKRGYSSGEDDEQDSEKFDISLVNCLNVLIGELQEERKGGFWEILGRHVCSIFIFSKVERGNSIMAGVVIDDG